MMNKLINKIWTYFVNRRLQRFAKSPIVFANEMERVSSKYFRLRVDCKVISIGNLNFGGTGKTPLIATIVNDFLPKDKKIGIVAKGYKRQNIEDVIISEDNYGEYSIKQIGDEPLMLFNHLNLPVSISEKKYRGLYNLDKIIHPDIAIIDDGYQHLWIERDLNILLLDNNLLNSLNNNKFILMREPISSINRADVILVPLNQHFNYQQFAKIDKKIIHFHSKLEKIKNEFLFKEKSKNYVAFAGIANPNRFFNTLFEHNIDPVAQLTFSDHHNYTYKDITKLLKIAKRKNSDLITTEKDLVKIIEFKDLFKEYKVNLDCLYIKIEIIEKEQFSEIIMEGLNV